MIQRVQNLYLFLALGCLVAAVFLPIGTYTFDVPNYIKGDLVMTPKGEFVENAVYELNNNELNVKEIQRLEAGQFFPVVIVNAILVAIVLLTLVKFKSLSTQYKLNRISFFLALITIIALVVGVFVIPSVLSEGIKENFFLPKSRLSVSVSGTFETGIAYYLYFAAMAFIFLASIGIKKDIKLLKSIDRIR